MRLARFRIRNVQCGSLGRPRIALLVPKRTYTEPHNENPDQGKKRTYTPRGTNWATIAGTVVNEPYKNKDGSVAFNVATIEEDFYTDGTPFTHVCLHLVRVQRQMLVTIPPGSLIFAQGKINTETKTRTDGSVLTKTFVRLNEEGTFSILSLATPSLRDLETQAFSEK